MAAEAAGAPGSGTENVGSGDQAAEAPETAGAPDRAAVALRTRPVQVSEGGTDAAVHEDGAGAEGSEGGTPCAGNALSLTANGSGTGGSGPNNDAAAARVDVDFGMPCVDLPLRRRPYALRTRPVW